MSHLAVDRPADDFAGGVDVNPQVFGIHNAVTVQVAPLNPVLGLDPAVRGVSIHIVSQQGISWFASGIRVKQQQGYEVGGHFTFSSSSGFL